MMRSTCWLTAWGLLFSVSQAWAAAPAVGEPAPAFAGPRQDGKVIQLSDFKGSPLVLYFYPKDDTPGCTQQACDFRDASPKLKQLGASVLGVSVQNQESHTTFKTRYKIPFDLIADPEGKVAEAYGVARLPLIGLLRRETFIIDGDGKVFKHYASVDVKTHIQDVIKDLEALKKK